MDLTPGEKAVLGQIRILYTAASGREQQLKALMMQWPPTHCEAYKRAFGALLEKELVQEVGAQVFRITDAGLRAIGVTPVAQPRVQPRPMREAPAPVAAPVAARRRGFLSWLFGARS
jgi:hypothetical protein